MRLARLGQDEVGRRPMKREAKRLASALLSLALVLGLMPGTAPTAFAEEPMEPPANDVQESPDARPLTNTTPQMRVAPESMEPQSQAVSYIERRWDDNTGAVIEEVKECTSYTLVTSNDTSWGSGWYVVQGEKEIAGRLSITDEANLILCDGAKLTVQQGITTTGAMLNIYAQSGGSGVLYAGTTDGTTSTCALGSAGIGGNPENSGGTVNIHGGSVTAIGGNKGGGDLAGGAGIGGGHEGSGGTVNIYGGSVTAIGGINAAGIGSGLGSNIYHKINGGTITIYGGTVNATAGAVSAGIGGGYVADSGNITINGGTVAATSDSGAGIGGGNSSDTIDGNNNITINGGVVNATGRDGAGIGSGHDGGSCTITINGGTVTATGNRYGAGIGCGSDGTTNGYRSINVTVNGGTVNATGNMGAGIGAGDDAPNSEYKYAIAINGGTVTATSTSAWGIGSSTGKAAGTVTLGKGVGVLAGKSKATAVDVTGTFAQAHDQKWAHTELKYSVAVADGIKNGTVEVDKSSAFAKETVKVAAKAADGYELDTVTVKDAEGKSIETKNGSFTMPFSNVTVSATFSKKAGPTPDPKLEPIELTGLGHVQTYGNVAATKSGKGILIGTIGEARRLEALTVSLPKGTNGVLEYRGHLQGIGWTNWTEGGRQCGTTGEARRLEAVQISLSGKVAEDYSVWYRVHSQTYGWLGWAHDGETAGTAGLSKRGEAVEVQVLPKGQKPEGFVEQQASYVGAVVANVHLQKVGWTGVASSVSFGTTGQARRLEAIRLDIANQPLAGGIEYDVHLQKTGWADGARDGALAGTIGEARRLEAIRIRLTGQMAASNKYSVWYRAHSQTYGWLGWAHDGQAAGTTGLAKRAEAIDVQILPSGQVPSGYDAARPALKSA